MAETTASGASAGKWLPAVAVAWIIPGGGHLLLKRPGRGGLIAFCVVAMYLLGLMMRGALFTPKADDLLTTVIYYGGFVGNLMSGILYFSRSGWAMRNPTWPAMSTTTAPSSWWPRDC